MKKAEVKNGKVTNVITGVSPKHYVDVIKKWESPKDYPLEFYVRGSKEPVVTIEGNEVHETWEFILKNIEQIKDIIYELLNKKRKAKQKETFNVNGVMISLKSDRAFSDIANLNTTAKSFKINKNEWAESEVKVQALKRESKKHIQSTYDWELEQNKLVSEMTTHTELKNYIETLK